MEIWQIQEIGSGYDTVFWKSLLTKVIVASSGFIVAFALTLINLFLVRKIALLKHFEAKIFEKKWIFIAIAAVISLILGSSIGRNSYLEILTALNATDFGINDPLFGKDMGYYIFVRPFLSETISFTYPIVIPAG